LKSETKIALIAAAGAVAWWLYSKTRALGDLIFSAGSVSGVQFSGSTPIVSANILIQNTSGTDLQINSFAGTVSSNGTVIGNVSNFSPVVIPGNSQVSMPITITLQLLGVASDIVNSIQTGSLKQSLALSGQANVNNFQLPVNVTYQIGS
jgi:LEA14-like dessication related protein